MGKYLTSDGSRLTEMRKALKTLITFLTDVITSKRLTEKKVTDLQCMFNLFICTIFDVNFRGKWRIELLTNILTAAVKIPVENSVPVKRTLDLYERLDIINIVTFLIFQTREITFPLRLIADFLYYLKDDSSYNYYALLFFRVNPQYITRTLNLSIENASPRELYFGISTGYFPYMEGVSESYSRLVKLITEYNEEAKTEAMDEETADSTPSTAVTELIPENVVNNICGSVPKSTFNYTPRSVLALLNKDGFISKNTFLMLMSML